MIFLYERKNEACGIYQIHNTYTDRYYIGQSKEFKERWKNHSWSLLRQKQQNRFFQSDFNKCSEILGHTDFLEFRAIELVPNSKKEDRNKREDWWISEYKQQGKTLYNFVTNNCSIEHRHSHNPEATKQKLSESAKKRWRNKEFREKMLETLKNLPANDYKHTEEARERIRKAVSTPENKKRLAELCQMMKPHTKTHNIRLISPNGMIYGPITNMAEFCRNHNIHPRSMQLLRNGTSLETKGWKLLKTIYMIYDENNRIP